MNLLCDCKHTSMLHCGRSHAPFLETVYQSLTAEEKEHVYRDLYGIEDSVVETPEFIHDKLEEFERQWNLLRDKTKKAYNMAVSMEQKQQQRLQGGSTVYVQSREFTLMFLRAERFNSRAAAERLAKYFTEKLKLFGSETLARRIQQSDFDEMDKQVLSSGFTSITGADRAGRLIFFLRPDRIQKNVEVVNLKRVLFYLITNAMEENVESQKKGVVVIRYKMNRSKFSPPVLPMLKLAMRVLPFRISGYHFCYNDPMQHQALNFILVFLPKYSQARMQCHYGSHEFCMFQLITYGIDVQQLPLTSDGEFKNEGLLQYLHIRRKIEESGMHSIF